MSSGAVGVSSASSVSSARSSRASQNWLMLPFPPPVTSRKTSVYPGASAWVRALSAARRSLVRGTHLLASTHCGLPSGWQAATKLSRTNCTGSAWPPSKRRNVSATMWRMMLLAFPEPGSVKKLWCSVRSASCMSIFPKGSISGVFGQLKPP